MAVMTEQFSASLEEHEVVAYKLLSTLQNAFYTWRKQDFFVNLNHMQTSKFLHKLPFLKFRLDD